MSALQKEMMKKRFPSLPPPSHAPSRQIHGRRRQKKYIPTSWKEYFERTEIVSIEANSFNVYFKGSCGPLLYLLHGGGHSALSWCVFAASLSKLVDCQIVALDIRGHGESLTINDSDLSAETLIRDVTDVFNALYSTESCPPTVIMGHSMGGAIAARVAAAGGIRSLVGLVIIDVVEGTAMESLSTMQSFLRGRPSVFTSLEHAIEWSIRSGQLRNVESACVSMPGQLKRIKKSNSSVQSTSSMIATPISSDITSIQEEGEPVDPVISSIPSDTDSYEYIWRIDLSNTEQYWEGWFKGLSKVLFTTSVPKMLILAGVDRLDKELTIAHMQGKFQMQVLSGCGHAVHEDVPDKVAEIIAGFLVRYKLTQAKETFEE